MYYLINSVKRCRWTFASVLSAVFLFRLWYMGTLPLSGDETYHWEWSRHLAFGYYDHPGLTAYLIRFFSWLFGVSNEYTTRLPALVMLTGTSIVCYLFARFVSRSRGGTDIESEHSGLIAGLLIVIVPIFAVFSVYISTDPPLIFLWALTVYLCFRAMSSGGWMNWIGLGVAMGFAMLSKFLAFFILPSVFLFMLISPMDRKWFAKPHAYIAGIVALLVFSPFIWWNATHDWATFMFNFVYRQKAQALELYHVPEYLLVQMLAISPGLFLFALCYMGTSVGDWRKRRDRASLYLFLSSIVPLVYFLYVSLRQEVSPHWPAAGWIGILVYLACRWASQSQGEVSSFNKRLRRISVGVCLFIIISMHLILHIPPKLIRFSWNYSKNADRINTDKQFERFGWHELGDWVSKTRQSMINAQEAKSKDVFVVCDQYGLASSVAFYTPEQLKTHLWRSKKVCGENYRFWDHYESLKSENAIFVTKKHSRAENATKKLKEHFQHVGNIEELPVMVDGKVGRHFYLVRCYNFDGRNPYPDS